MHRGVTFDWPSILPVMYSFVPHTCARSCSNVVRHLSCTTRMRCACLYVILLLRNHVLWVPLCRVDLALLGCVAYPVFNCMSCLRVLVLATWRRHHDVVASIFYLSFGDSCAKVRHALWSSESRRPHLLFLTLVAGRLSVACSARTAAGGR